MKNIWKILNIEPTKDVNEIKRAYTALAHQINPEEEPDKGSSKEGQHPPGRGHPTLDDEHSVL